MRLIVSSMAASTLLATLAIAPIVVAQQAQLSNYTVTDLGTVGGPPDQPYFIANNGLMSGAAATPSGAMHAVLWYKKLKMDIGTPGLGGPNSAAFAVNEKGQFVGEAQASVNNLEDFCGFNASGLPRSVAACLPFLWQNGVMTKLPTLGGANGAANWINKRGEVAGYAENTLRDPDPACPVFQFRPVFWENGEIHELLTYPGDPDGVAASINDNGQLVGSSGACAPFDPNSGLYLLEKHALLWQHGTVTDLGNLGGTGAGAGNHACAINNQGQVVGHSDLRNDATFHGFLWTGETGMRDLGTLSGDFASVALSINESGEVVGASLAPDFSPRAYLWENGRMTDLNTLIAANPSKLYLQLAASINSRGEIIGFAQTSNGETHGFLAAPSKGEAGGESGSLAEQSLTRPAVLPENAGTPLQQRLPFGRLGARLMDPR